MNPYKPQLTSAQGQAVDQGRSRLLSEWNASPYSDGQQAGEFVVEFNGEYVDCNGSIDSFMIMNANRRLDDVWYQFESRHSGVRIEPLGRGNYRALVPHAVYFTFAKIARHGLPFVPDVPCICTSLLQIFVAATCAYAAFAWAPS